MSFYLGWICKNCQRAINSERRKVDTKSVLRCKICGKSQKLNQTIHSGVSDDALVITEWVKQWNSRKSH